MILLNFVYRICASLYIYLYIRFLQQSFTDFVDCSGEHFISLVDMNMAEKVKLLGSFCYRLGQLGTLRFVLNVFIVYAGVFNFPNKEHDVFYIDVYLDMHICMWFISSLVSPPTLMVRHNHS